MGVGLFAELDFDAYDVLIVDGMVDAQSQGQSQSALWNSHIIRWRAHKTAKNLPHFFIFVSSLRVTMKKAIRDSVGIDSVVSFPPWSLDEFLDATRHPEFWAGVQHNFGASGDSVTIEDLVVDKFRVAGFCARWMFGFTTNDVLAEIHHELRQVHDFSAYLQGSPPGSASLLAVNSLFVEFGDSKKISVAVSEYVLKKMVQNCDAQVIKVVADFSFELKNASFDGWILEADFLMQLRHADSNHPFTLSSARGLIPLSYNSEVDNYLSDRD